MGKKWYAMCGPCGELDWRIEDEDKTIICYLLFRGDAEYIAKAHNEDIDVLGDRWKVTGAWARTFHDDLPDTSRAKRVTDPLEDRIAALEERLGHHMATVNNRLTTVTVERELDVGALRERVAELENRVGMGRVTLPDEVKGLRHRMTEVELDAGALRKRISCLMLEVGGIEELEHRFINHDHYTHSAAVASNTGRTSKPTDDEA